MTSSVDSTLRLVSGDSDIQFNGVKKFDCGDRMLNKFLEQLKRQCGRDNIKALVLIDDSNQVAGFVTASLYQLGSERVPDVTFPYALPPLVAVMKISMIAIDKKYQRQGWGVELMRAALDYALESAEMVKGIKGVYLDAKVEARSFYEALDFGVISEDISPNDTVPMFIAMDTLRNSKMKMDQSA
ncbi:GNAT family N-acetyltransferase [Salmonella enterica]|nr:GNAT family N-acetyltransferase [Salmonella enterica subsp. enterica serovar Typhimurium]ECF0162709.1 GNAT family N-acetyltransferase [Salmonella enterica subsp. enterica serovar Litchfield]EHL2886982.1 GNAT family N-acetyltransferase [Salmonella enterica]